MEWEPFEEKAREQGFRVIAGLDEAGRGPLAGPVVAAAVVLLPKPEPEKGRGFQDPDQPSRGRRLCLSSKKEP